VQCNEEGKEAREGERKKKVVSSYSILLLVKELGTYKTHHMVTNEVMRIHNNILL
jgi:hypothetical protein